jgi:hypothetical protein
MLGLEAAPARSGRTALASYNDLLNCHPPPPSVAANNLLKKVIFGCCGQVCCHGLRATIGNFWPFRSSDREEW